MSLISSQTIPTRPTRGSGVRGKHKGTPAEAQGSQPLASNIGPATPSDPGDPGAPPLEDSALASGSPIRSDERNPSDGIVRTNQTQ